MTMNPEDMSVSIVLEEDEEGEDEEKEEQLVLPENRKKK